MATLTHEFTLREYRNMVTEETCRYCGKQLPQEVSHYPHPQGWPVARMVGLHWLYLHCACDYDWALWKLGVPRILAAEETQ